MLFTPGRRKREKLKCLFRFEKTQEVGRKGAIFPPKRQLKNTQSNPKPKINEIAQPWIFNCPNFRCSYCNRTHSNAIGITKNLVERYLPDLFQPHLLCAGYPASSRGSCQGDSGGPLMLFDESVGQYFQIGLVSGGVSNCGNTEIPDYYVRLDHPEVSRFLNNPDTYQFSSGSVPVSPSESTVPINQSGS